MWRDGGKGGDTAALPWLLIQGRRKVSGEPRSSRLVHDGREERERHQGDQDHEDLLVHLALQLSYLRKKRIHSEVDRHGGAKYTSSAENEGRARAREANLPLGLYSILLNLGVSAGKDHEPHDPLCLPQGAAAEKKVGRVQAVALPCAAADHGPVEFIEPAGRGEGTSVHKTTLGG